VPAILTNSLVWTVLRAKAKTPLPAEKWRFRWLGN
jgi:hypothetical protein